MTIDLHAIEAAARGATPGPWTVCAWAGANWPERRVTVGSEEKPGTREAIAMNARYASRPREDMHHIATMDPQAALALVERVRELESMCRCARVEMQHMLHCANTDSVPHDGDDFHDLLGRMDTYFGGSA